MHKSATRQELLCENERLREKLQYAEDVLRAIRNGEVDALVVSTAQCDQVYTLESAEKPYRVLVENMPEGAITLSASGLILYSNRCFAEILKVPHERLVATPLRSWVAEDRLAALDALLRQGRTQLARGEILLRASGGEQIPVLITAAAAPSGVEGELCIVVVDLTEQKRSEEIVAAERLARSILENAAEAIVVCDTGGRVVRASRAAGVLCGSNPLRRPFGDAFPLECTPDCLPGCPSPTGVASYLLAEALEGRTVTGVEARLCRGGAEPAHLLIAAGPVRSLDNGVLGCVLTLTEVTAYKQGEALLRQQRTDIEMLNERLRRSMAETHHRIKNNLQVIAALVDIQVMNDTSTIPTAELKRLGQHVRSLAAVHDLLTLQTKLSDESTLVHTAEMLGRLKPLLDGMIEGHTISLRVEDFPIPARHGTALAMLVNELVANATKHGQGDIGLSLAVEDGVARLQVTDHGPGFPRDFDPARAAHTGLELIESAGRWDLQGEVSYDNRPEGGACVTVSFPVGTASGRTEPDGVQADAGGSAEPASPFISRHTGPEGQG